MKTIHLISAVCAVAGALFVSGCALFAPAEAKNETKNDAAAETAVRHFISIDRKSAAELLFQKTVPQDLTPSVYAADDISKDLHVGHAANMSYDEDGMLRVRVVAVTDELPFFTWLFFPNRTCRISYRFFWFDESGKVCKGMTPADCREVMPGDSVRFSAKATDPSVKRFALILTSGCSGMCCDAEKTAEKSADKK